MRQDHCSMESFDQDDAEEECSGHRAMSGSFDADPDADSALEDQEPDSALVTTWRSDATDSTIPSRYHYFGVLMRFVH